MMQVLPRSLAIGTDRIELCEWRPDSLQTDVPILLLHDSLGCVALWRDFPVLLAEHTQRRVIAWDRAGFGKSSPRAQRPGLDFIREEGQAMSALWDVLGLTQVVLLGHSVGGGMAIEAAAQHPDRVVAVITLAAQAFAEPRTLDGIRAAQQQFADPAQRARLARYHGDRTDWVLDAWIGVWLHPEFTGWSLDKTLPRVRCPLLAIHGGNDEYGSVEHPRRMQRLTEAKTQVVIIEGGGHVLHREQSDAVLSAVAAFLA